MIRENKYFKFIEELESGEICNLKSIELEYDEAMTWMELLDNFVDFLGSCGYIVDDDGIIKYLKGDD